MTRKNIDQSTISKRFGILSAPLSCFLAIVCFALLFIASPNDAQAQTAKPVITTPDYTSTNVVPFTITGTADSSTTSVQLYVFERRGRGSAGRRYKFFKVGGTVTVSASGDWMIPIPANRLPEGVFKSFSATATDSGGSTSAQFLGGETVEIRRDTRVPGTPTITTQAQSVNDAPFTISGRSEDIHLREVGATVELFVNTAAGGSSLGIAAVTEKAWTKSITLVPGLNTFTVTVTDSAGNGPSVRSDAVGITLQAPPTVEITSTSGDNGDTVKAETLIYTATFGAGVNGFIASDITISGSANGNAPTIVNFTGDDGDSTYTFEVAKGSSDGTVIVSIPANVAANSSGNSNTATVSPYILTIDTTPPGIPNITTTATTVNTESFTISGTAESSSLVFIGDGFTRARADGTWEAEVTLARGLNTLTATARDAVGNVSGESTQVIITLDYIGVNLSYVVNDKTLTFTVILDRAVSDFSTDNINLTGTANGGSLVVSNFQSIDINNKRYTFELVGKDRLDGEVIVLFIPAPAGDINKFVPNVYTFTIDQPPSVVITSASGDSGDTVGTDTLAYTVKFNEVVSGFRASDIMISGMASGGSPTVASFATNDSQTYTFEVQKGSSDGTVRVSIPANVAMDSAGNSNTATVFPYILTIDTTAPESPTIHTGGNYTASYTINGNAEAGSTVALSVGTGTGVASSLGSFPSNANGDWVANVSLSYGTNTFTAVATDAVGNVSAETRAVIVRGRPAKPVINGGSRAVRLRGIDSSVYPLTGTAASGLDIQLLINGQLSTIAGTSTTTVDGSGGWTVSFTLSPGENRITVTATDALGNVSEESNAVTITLDVLPPLTAIITSSSGLHNTAVSTDTLSYTVMFSEAVHSFSATRDITIQGSANGGSPAITNIHIADNIAYSFYVAKGSSDGDVLVHIQDVVVADEIINTPIYRLIIDTTRPVPSITSALGDSGDRVSTETLSYTVDFGEAVNGFAANDITISGSANGNDTPAIVNFVGSDGDRTYTFEVQRGSSDGTVIVAIPANVAMDDAGNSNTATVSPYTLTIDTVKPGKPEITVIADTIYVNNTASLTLSGTADVSSTAVELFEGDVSLGTTTATNGIWAIDIMLTFSSGVRNLRLVTAIATDSAGNQSEKSDEFNVDVVLDTEKPRPPRFEDKFELRQDVSMSTFTLTGTAEEEATIQIWRSNNNSNNHGRFRGGISGSISTLTGTATADVHGNWEFTVILSEGFNLYRASQQDRAGNVSELSRVAFIDLDTIPPDEPHIRNSQTTTVSAAKYTITGDEDVFGVDLYNGGVTSDFFIGTVAAGNRNDGDRWDFVVTLHEGLNQIWVIERDRAGNRSEPAGPVNITLDRVPTVTIMSGTNPSNAAVDVDTLFYTVKFNEAVNGFAANDITISGTANGGSPTVTSFAGVDGDSTYTFEVEKGSSDGTVAVSIADNVAQDSSGFSNTASDIYNLTIDTTPPAAPVITPSYTLVDALKQIATFRIGGTHEIGSIVKLSIDTGTGLVSLGTEHTRHNMQGVWEVSVGDGLVGGTNTFTATATDSAGNVSGMSNVAVVNVSVSIPPPPSRPVITTQDMRVNGSQSVTIRGTADAGNLVKLFDTRISNTSGNAINRLLDTVTVTADGVWDITINAGAPGLRREGANTITVTATNAAGIASSVLRTVILTKDSTPPTAQIRSYSGHFGNRVDAETLIFAVIFTEPVTGFSGDMITVVGSANDGSPAVSRFNTNDSQTYTFEVARGNSDGSVTVSINANVALDIVGNRGIGTDTYSLVIDTETQPPQVFITSRPPLFTNMPSFQIGGITANTGSIVELFRDVGTNAVPLGTASVTEDGQWTKTIELIEGANTIRVTATDRTGRSEASDSFTITLDRTISHTVITMPLTSTSVNTPQLHLSGTAEPNSSVQILSSGSIIAGGSATLVAGRNGVWTVFVSLNNGDNMITATATDVAGNTSTSNVVIITLDTTSPNKPNITAPANTLTNTVSLTLHGTAELDTTVQLLSSGNIIAGATATATNGDWTITFTLSEGFNTITATATDAAGNVSTPSASVTITLDSTPPAKPTIITPDATLVQTATLTLIGLASGASAVELFVDNTGTSSASLGTATVANGTWTITFDLEEGTNRITATAADAAGNVSESDVVTITLDSGAPNKPTIIAPTATLVGTASLTLQGGAEAGSTIQLWSLSGSSVVAITGATATATATNGGWTITFDLREGLNTITATATDVAGNKSPQSDVVTITRDTTKPIETRITVPADTLVKTATLTLSGVAEPDSTVQLSSSGSIIAGATAVATNGVWEITFDLLSAGDNIITATATDAAGNMSVISGAVTITLDSTPPAKPTIITPDATLVQTATLTLIGLASGASAVELFVDTGTSSASLGTATATNGTWTITFDLREGENIITATATDAAGNISVASDAVTITLDTVIPVVAITTAADTVNTAQFMVSGTADTGSTVQLSSSGDIITDATAIAIDGAWTIIFRLPRDGDNIIKVIATDGAGNVSTPSNAVTIRLDTDINKPHITPPAVTAVNTESFTLSGTAELDSTVQLWSSGSIINDAAATATNGTWTITFDLGEGTNTITAIATDRAGNISTQSEAVTITLDIRAPGTPTITLDSPLVNVVSLTLRGTAEMDSTVQLLLSGTIINGATAIATGGIWEIGVTLTTGVNTFTAKSTDAAGNVSESDAVTITRDIVAPDQPVISVPAATSMINDTASFTFSGMAESGATIQLLSSKGPITGATATVDNNGDWEIITSTLFDGYSRDSLNTGISVAFHVIATDRAGNISTESNTVIIAIDIGVPTTPVITSPSTSVNVVPLTLSGTADTGSKIQLLSSGNIIPGATTIALDDVWTIAFNRDTIAFHLGEGDHTITATATDAAGNMSTPSAAVTITLILIDSIVTQSAHEILISFFGDVTSTVIPSDFSVSGVQSTPTVIAASKSETANKILLTLSDNIVNDETITLSYAKGTSSIRVQSIALASFSSRVVINAVAVDGTSPSIEEGATNAAGSNIVLMFNEYMSVTNASTADFTVSVDSSGVPSKTIDVTALTVERDKLTIELMSNIVDGETVLLEYEAREGPSAGITDVAGNALASVRRAITNTAPENDPPSGTLTIDGTLTVGMTLTANTDAISDDDDTGTFTYQWQSDGVDIENAIGKTFTLTSEQIRKRIRVEARYTDGTNHVEILVSDQTDQGVKNIRPVVFITTVEERVNESSFTITGTATADSSVELFRERVSLGTVTAMMNGTWSFPVTLGEGANIFIATATDQDDANNQSEVSDPVTITLDTTAPDKPVIAAPADTLTNTALLTLSGDAEAGSTVQLLSSGTIIVDAATTATTTATNGTGTWTITFRLAEEGVNVITATATDVVGNGSEISEAVTITLDSVAPAVTITTRPQAVNTASFTLAGTVEEAGSTVEIFRGGTSIGVATVTGTAWTIDVTLTADVANVFTAQAIDSADNESEISEAVTITLDIDAPTVAITTTAQTVKEVLFTIKGTAKAGSIVELLRGTESIGTVTATNGAWSIEVTLISEDNVITVTATDQNDANKKSTLLNAVTITQDSTAPSKPVISSSNTQVNMESFTINGTADVNSVVEVLQNGSSIGTVTATSGFWTITVMLIDGANVFTAKASDTIGNKSGASEAVIITLDRTAPAVGITTTVQAVNTVSFTLNGTAEAGSVVDVRKDGISIGTETATGGTWTIIVTLDEGTNTFAATATDAAGNTSPLSEAVIITLDIDAPTVAITTTAQTVKEVLFTIRGTAEAGSVVDVGEDGISIGTETATGGTWTIIVTLDEGTNTFAATATDAAGNTSPLSEAVIITLDRTAPAVGITTTVQAVNTASFTLTGTAEAGSTVELLKGTESIGTVTATNGFWTITVTLIDGANVFTAKASDAIGNRSGASEAVIITLDRTAPAVGITTTVQAVNTVSFTLTGTAEAGSTVELLKGTESIGTVTATNGFWTITVTLIDGANVFTAKATDVAGNESEVSGPVTITLDRTAPAVAIDTLAQTVNTALFTLTGTAEAGSVVDVREDGISIGTETATGGTWTIIVTLDEGTNTFAATATDRAGNTSDATDAVIITLDRTAPAVAIDTLAQTVNTASFTLTGTAEAGSTVELLKGTESIGTVTATNGFWTITVTLIDGANELTATATDAANNKSEASEAVIITLDRTAPAVGITTTVQAVNTVSFTLTGTAEAGSTVELLKGTESIGTVTATNGFWTITVTLIDGANVFTAKATDVAGNESEVSGPVTITLDRTAPAVAIDTLAQTVNTALFTLTGTAEAGSVVDVREDGISIGTETATGGTWTIIVTLDEGTNTFAATATDRAGNTSDATDAVIITLDRTAPAVAIDTLAQTVNTASFTLTGTAEAGSTVELLKGTESIGTVTATNGFWTITVTLIDGANELTATATDAANNKSEASEAVIITLDRTAPAVGITTTVQAVNTVSFTLTGTAEAGSTVELLKGTESIGTVTATNGFWTITVTLIDGANVFTAKATDVAGNESEVSGPVTITLDRTAPAVAIDTLAQTVNTASFTLTGTAEAGSTVELLKGTESIGTVTATNGFWTITVTLIDGANELTATATDAANNKSEASEAVIITLDRTAPAVAINTLAQTVNTASFTLTGTAEAGSVVDVREDGISIGTETATGGTWTIIVTLDEGANVFTAKATDVAGNESEVSGPVTITLDRTAPAVAIDTLAQTVNTNSFTLTGTAEAGSVVDVRKDGISIGTETATGGTWTIIVTLDEGTNTFTAIATDAAGNTSPPSDAVIITLEIPEFIEANMVETQTITTNDGEERVVGVTLGVSQTVTITINAFTTTTVTTGEKDAINVATNTDDFDTVKNNFMFLGGSSDVVKVDLLENAIVDIDIVLTDSGGLPVTTEVCSVVRPCKVSLPYTDDDLKRLGVESPTELVVFHYTGSPNKQKQWTELKSFPGSQNTIVGETTSFSPFVLGTVSRASAQFHQAITARFTQALVANVARTVEGRLGTAFSDTPQLASYQLDGQTVQLDGSGNLQDAMVNKLPHYAQSLKDGTMDWKEMLSRSSFVLPLNAVGDSDSEQAGMTLWGHGDYTKLSGKSDGLDWNGSLVGFQVGIDSRIHDDLLVGGLVSFGKAKADYTFNGTSGDYKLKNMTSVHPYMAWRNGDMSSWGSAGYGQGQAEVSTGNVRSAKVSMLSLSGGAKGKLSQPGLSLKGDILLVRTDVENTAEVNNQRLRLVLESERQRTLASGGTITPVLEVGLRYDSGDGESGLGAVLGAGIRHSNLDGWVVEGKVHAVVGQNNYEEWGVRGMIRKAPKANERGLSFSVNPSYGATDISMQQVYGRDQTSVSNNGTNDDYAMRLNARMDYGLSARGIRGMLIPYSEATLGGQSKLYELGINWKRHSGFNINLSAARETSDISKRRILLESKIQF